MLPLMINVQPAVAPASNQSGNTPQAVPSTTLSDASAAARQQLPVAVAATGSALGFSPNTQPQPKPTIRTITLGPTSSLAAQVLAQEPEMTAEEMQIFMPRPKPQEPVREENDQDYLEDMRIARGEVSRSEPKPAPAEKKAVALPSVPATPANVPSTPVAFQQIRTFLSILVPVGRKTTLSHHARGTVAYEIATTRNGSISLPATVSAEL